MSRIAPPSILRDIEDLSYEEIAEVTAVSLGTVKSRLMRGRQALKKRLEQYVKEHGAGTRDYRQARARKLPHRNMCGMRIV